MMSPEKILFQLLPFITDIIFLSFTVTETQDFTYIIRNIKYKCNIECLEGIQIIYQNIDIPLLVKLVSFWFRFSLSTLSLAYVDMYAFFSTALSLLWVICHHAVPDICNRVIALWVIILQYEEYGFLVLVLRKVSISIESCSYWASVTAA